MRVTRNSKSSRVSKPAAADRTPASVFFVVFAVLLGIGSGFAAFCYANGWTLYWGDAEAHLNIARRIIDSRTPGYEQIGTVWLPVPHALMLPFAAIDPLWRSGLAGVIPNILCFALAGTALFATARRLFGGSSAAGWCAALLFALNPNVLYLQSIPMTEAAMLASLTGLVYFVVVFTQTGSMVAVIAAALCSVAGCLTRYEGWFLIPVVCAVILISGGAKRWQATILFGAIASLAPLYWLAHNQYMNSNALDFYNGPYSAKAIYERGHPPGRAPFPAVGNWQLAGTYYKAAVEFCAGPVLFWAGLAGIAAALWKRAWWAVAVLATVPVFYVISLHSSGSGAEIFVPTLWPQSYYNTRYGMGTLPLLVIGCAALAAWHRAIAGVLVVAALIPWVVYPRPENWVTWKESQVNSITRRAWTAEAAEYMKTHYRPGDGVFTSFSDLTAVFREAGIPLRETLHEGNGPAFLGAQMRPDLFLHEKWAIAIAASPLADAMMKVNTSYTVVRTIYVKDGPVIEIYRRTHDLDLNPLHESAWRTQ